MTITSTWGKIEFPRGEIEFNVNVGTDESPNYYPIQFRVHLMAETTDEYGKRKLTNTKNGGTNQATPFDLTTTQGRKDFYNALPAYVQPFIKELFIDSIDEDPTA